MGGTTASRLGEDGRERVTSELRWNSFRPTGNQQGHGGVLFGLSRVNQTSSYILTLSSCLVLFLRWFAPPTHTHTPNFFSLFLLPSRFHLQLFSPLLCSLTMSRRTVGQREAERTTSPLSVTLHTSPATGGRQPSVTKLGKRVGVKTVAGFETINMRRINREGG